MNLNKEGIAHVKGILRLSTIVKDQLYFSNIGGKVQINYDHLNKYKVPQGFLCMDITKEQHDEIKSYIME